MSCHVRLHQLLTIMMGNGMKVDKEMVLLKVKLAALVPIILFPCGLGFTSLSCFIFLSNQFVHISFEVGRMYFRCTYNRTQQSMSYHLS